jgi:hypothetical protein
MLPGSRIRASAGLRGRQPGRYPSRNLLAPIAFRKKGEIVLRVRWLDLVTML